MFCLSTVQLDAAVLRQALLGDVDARHDLQTRQISGPFMRSGMRSRSTHSPSMR